MKYILYVHNFILLFRLTVAALAIAEIEPDLSMRILQRALKNLPIAGGKYAFTTGHTGQKMANKLNRLP